ncbi:leucine-rich repeat-containing protein 24-like isoform X2 [Dermacentor albipictus]
MASHSRRSGRAVATLATLRLPLLVFLQLALGTCVEPVGAACPKKDLLRPCSCFSYHNYERVECKDVDRRALKSALAALRGSSVFEFELSKYNLKDAPSDVFGGVRVTELYTYMADFTNVCNASNLFDGFDDTLTMIEIKRAKGLEQLHWSALGRLKNLRRLFVFSSDFPRLDKSFSLMPKSLSHVMVQGGSLERVDEGAFLGLEIRDLEISFTRLEKITRNVFPTPATNLTVLSLRHNRIRSLPEDMFNDMPALVLLDVSNNCLQTLSESSMAPVLWNLRLLEMSNNQYFCDCNLTWVGRAFTNSNYLERFSQRNDIRCNAPPQLHGTDVLTLTDDNLGCADLVPLSTH